MQGAARNPLRQPAGGLEDEPGKCPILGFSKLRVVFNRRFRRYEKFVATKTFSERPIFLSGDQFLKALFRGSQDRNKKVDFLQKLWMKKSHRNNEGKPRKT